MSLGLLIALQFLHVFFAIAWFGTSLAIHFLVVPAASTLPAAGQVGWYKALGDKGKIVFPVLGGLTILLGIGRGIAGGVFGSLGTPYGVTWIAALVVGIALMGWGARMTGPAAERLGRSTTENVAANVAGIIGIGRIELAGFFVIFALMIAMRFGY